MAKLENGELDATFVEKYTGCQSTGASANNGDSWLRDGHVKQSGGREGHIYSSIRTRKQNFSELRFSWIKIDYDSNEDLTPFTKRSRSNTIYNYEGSGSIQVVAELTRHLLIVGLLEESVGPDNHGPL
jgi:hypothetical protein